MHPLAGAAVKKSVAPLREIAECARYARHRVPSIDDKNSGGDWPITRFSGRLCEKRATPQPVFDVSGHRTVIVCSVTRIVVETDEEALGHQSAPERVAICALAQVHQKGGKSLLQCPGTRAPKSSRDAWREGALRGNEYRYARRLSLPSGFDLVQEYPPGLSRLLDRGKAPFCTLKAGREFKTARGGR
ncbi:hypothetical protein KM043_010124 [Ampulex compressa]|nr:hypothetical protein KM043_010124 [Ampulex compressa]